MRYSWGQPFLDHTFLYHLTRLDHRHNFSPYFYPIYQSLFPSSGASSLDTYPLLGKVLHHPLTSFLPQTTLVAFAGFRLPNVIGIEGTMFFQTCLFVVFNKVVTSQVCRSPYSLPVVIPSWLSRLRPETDHGRHRKGSSADWVVLHMVPPPSPPPYPSPQYHLHPSDHPRRRMDSSPSPLASTGLQARIPR